MRTCPSLPVTDPPCVRLGSLMLDLPVTPMLAAPTETIPAPGALPGGAVYEPKFDGYRALVFVDADRVRVQSRRGYDITSAFPDIVEAARAMVPPGTVLDGELVVWGGTGLDFPALGTRLATRRQADRAAAEHPATLMVFDVLAEAGADVRGEVLADRYARLGRILTAAAPPLQRVPSTTDLDVAQAWVADYAHSPNLGIEGLVIKGAATRYVSGQRGWLKYRIRATHDLVVGAVLGAVGNPTRLVLGYFDARGRLVVAGATTALGVRQRRDLAGVLRTVAGEHPWPERLPAGWIGQWSERPAGEARAGRLVGRVEPEIVVEVLADTAFEHGRWRHPLRYVRTHPDKAPNEVRHPHGEPGGAQSG